MDKVFIDQLNVDTCIGIYAWERQVRQTLTISLSMGWDISQAATTDDIALTLNYAEVAEFVKQYGDQHRHLLLESFVEDLAQLLLERFRLPWVKVRVAKNSIIASARQVGIEIERWAEPKH